MSKPLKSYEVTLKFRLNVNEIVEDDVELWDVGEEHDPVEARRTYVNANRELQRAFLEHPEVMTRLLPDLLADLIEGQAGMLTYQMLNSKLHNASKNDRELIEHTEPEAREWLEGTEKAGVLAENTEVYADSFDLIGVDAQIKEI